MVPFLNFNIICLIQVFLIKGEDISAERNPFEIWSRVIQIFIFIEIRESCGKHHSDVHNFLEENYPKKSLTHFDSLQPKNVSAILGKTAFLTCVVKNLKPTQKVEYLKILTPLKYTGNIPGVLGPASWCPYSDSRRADLHIRREILL